MQLRNWSLLLHHQQLLDPEQIAPVLIEFGIQRSDVIRACRRQRGIFLSGLTDLEAENARDGLAEVGVAAIALPDGAVAGGERPVEVQRLVIHEDGIEVPALTAQRKVGLIEWRDIRVVVAGLIRDDEDHSLKDVVEVIASGATSNEDHRNFARKSFERLRNPSFPLNHFLLAKPDEFVNVERLKPEPRKPAARKGIIFKRDPIASDESETSRYVSDFQGLQGRLLIATGSQVFLLKGEEALLEKRGESSAGHWLRAFHALIAKIVDELRSLAAKEIRVPVQVGAAQTGSAELAEASRLPQHAELPQTLATRDLILPHDTLAFADGFDQAHYLFHDEAAAHEYLRWYLHALYQGKELS